MGKIKGIWYYFDTDGVMLSNRGKQSLSKDSGAMAEKNGYLIPIQ